MQWNGMECAQVSETLREADHMREQLRAKQAEHARYVTRIDELKARKLAHKDDVSALHATYHATLEASLSMGVGGRAAICADVTDPPGHCEHRTAGEQQNVPSIVPLERNEPTKLRGASDDDALHQDIHRLSGIASRPTSTSRQLSERHPRPTCRATREASDAVKRDLSACQLELAALEQRRAALEDQLSARHDAVECERTDAAALGELVEVRSDDVAHKDVAS